MNIKMRALGCAASLLLLAGCDKAKKKYHEKAAYTSAKVTKAAAKSTAYHGYKVAQAEGHELKEKAKTETKKAVNKVSNAAHNTKENLKNAAHSAADKVKEAAHKMKDRYQAAREEYKDNHTETSTETTYEARPVRVIEEPGHVVEEKEVYTISRHVERETEE